MLDKYKSFFLNNNHSFLHFQAFNIIYFVFLIITFLLFILILNNAKNLDKINKKKKNIIRTIFGLILCITVILRRGTFIYYDVYNWRYHLDIGFCNMTSILFIFYCFTGNKKLFNVCYYCAFYGPLLSILVPVLDIDVNNYSFVSFIIIHHAVFLMNMIFVIFERKKFSIKDKLIANKFIIIYISLCCIFNIIFDTKYNYLTEFITKPLLNNQIIFIIANNIVFNLIVLVITNFIMTYLGGLILKYYRKKDLYYE